jgi:formamidopyrimidine-DNA glycosylase
VVNLLIISGKIFKEFIENLQNKTIKSIDRRAKNLIIEVTNEKIILIHLKMTGQLVFVASNKGRKSGAFSPLVGGHPIQESEEKLPHKHTYIIFHLDNGTLYYNDVRQFGYVLYYPSKNILIEEKHFEDIGIEPFDKNFTLEYFNSEIKKYNSPIKKVLLDQKIVVGCGNIYCDEVLWHSSVLPTRSCKSLNKNEIEKIYNNIKIILQNAIESGGSSVANYLLADGSKGNYAHSHKAYKKDGQKCAFKRCIGTIEKINFTGRGTHFCPVHQK